MIDPELMDAMRCGHAGADFTQVRILAGARGDCAPGVQSGTQTSENKAPCEPSTCAMSSAYACAAEFNAGADWAGGSGVLRPPGLKSRLLADANVVNERE